jgi:DNA invertase Pin-like site-specific DNA recombinase
MGQDIAGKIASTRCGHQLCMAEQHVTPMTRQQLQKRSGKKLVGNLARAAKLAATRRKTAKLTMEQVQEMRQLRAEGVTTHEAAKRYGITQGAAAKVMRGDSWRDYSSPYTQLMTRRQA